MNYKTKKAPAEAATSAEAKGETRVVTDISTSQYYNESEGYISSLLMHGKENALSTRRLLQITGLNNSRELQTAIERERKRIPICTKIGSDGGYFLPSEDPIEARRELQEYCRYMGRKGAGCFRSAISAKAMLRALERDLAGQEKIEDL